MVKNPCTICGKERVVIETISEIINGSVVVSKKASCPDPDCQLKVEMKLEKERLTRERLTASSMFMKTANGSSSKTDVARTTK